MPTFIVDGRQKDGRVQKFRVDADSATDAASKVAARGITAGAVVEAPSLPTAVLPPPPDTAAIVREVIRALAADRSVRADMVKLLRRAIYNGVTLALFTIILVLVLLSLIVVLLLLVYGKLHL